MRSAKAAALRCSIKRRLRLAGFATHWNASTRELHEMIEQARTRAGNTPTQRRADASGKPGTEARQLIGANSY